MSLAEDLKILQSIPFKFVVGEDKTEFFIHPTILEKHSSPLNALVKGHMQEAQQRFATLPDIDPGTFARAGQYFYCGDYGAAAHSVPANSCAIGNKKKPKPDSGDAKLSDAKLSDTQDDWFISSTKSKRGKNEPKRSANACEWCGSPEPQSSTQKNQKTRQEEAWGEFMKTVYKVDLKTPIFTVRSNKDACEEYKQVFLSHARMFTFADKYDIDNLSRLALHKLHQTLVKFTIYDQHVDEIVDLLQYVYSNTMDREVGMSPMRQLVIDYASCKIGQISGNTKFEEVQRQEPQISIDLMRALMTRIDG